MPNPIDATDYAGSALSVGDRVTITAEVVGSAGGVGQVVLRYIDPSTNLPRTGGQQTDINYTMDGNLVTKV